MIKDDIEEPQVNQDEEGGNKTHNPFSPRDSEQFKIRIQCDADDLEIPTN